MRDFNWVDFLIQKRRIRLIDRYVPVNCNLLDIGCGYYPKNLIALKDKVKSAVGIDKEPPAVSPSSNIRLVSYNIEKSLPFLDNEFDCVTMLAVLEHFHYPSDVIKECWRVLMPGGRLIVTVPSNYSKPMLDLMALFRVISREEISGHLHYFTIKQLFNIIKDSALNIILAKYYNLFMNIIIVCEKG